MFKYLKGKVIWRWKNTIIDFSNYDDFSKYADYEKSNYYKVRQIFHYIGCPFNQDVHEWENGQYSTEFNYALEYAFELNLVEQVYYVKELDSYLDYDTYQNWLYYKEDNIDEE